VGDLIRFVDSIAASPTLRLDLNDESIFWVRAFNAPPPRLRRSIASNAMRDGINVGSASYDGRTLTIELECRRTTQDLAATEIQKLWRELDRETNFLMYQPTGATKPVFFRTYRSDASQLEDVMAQVAMRRFTIEVLAEPFALGLRESLGPYTVTNDPAAASNGCYVDVSGVIGDVTTPPVIVDTGTIPHYWTMGVRQHGTPSSVTWFIQAESTAGGVNTANPGGGPDAAMSGTGANNYLRTSFANTVNDLRLSLSSASLPDAGDYRLLAVVRRSDSTSDMLAQVGNTLAGNLRDQVVIPKTTERQIVELGTWSIDSGVVGNNATGSVLASDIGVYAQRTTGTGTLDWDFFLFVPADEAGLAKFYEGTAAPNNLLLDCVNQTVRGFYDGADPFTGTGAMYQDPYPIGVAGAYPTLRPNQTNRFVMLASTGTVAGRTPTKTQTLVLTFHYWPRYLFVRPVST